MAAKIGGSDAKHRLKSGESGTEAAKIGGSASKQRVKSGKSCADGGGAAK